MVCAGVMLACALISSNLGTRWDAWALGPHAYATLQQGGCTSAIQTQTHCFLARGSGRRQKNCMFVCYAPLAAAYECWAAELHLMPQPPALGKSCSNPRAYKAEVHYQRGTLVESRPCWQVVPLPSPAFPPTSPDEHYTSPVEHYTSPDEHESDFEAHCQFSLSRFPRFVLHADLSRSSACTHDFSSHTTTKLHNNNPNNMLSE